jgi:membrane protein implicated in regulation of membrane protease activity
VLFVVLAALIAPFMLLAALLAVACGLGLLFLMPLSILSIARHLDWAVAWQDRQEAKDLELQEQVRPRGTAVRATSSRDEGPLPLA